MQRIYLIIFLFFWVKVSIAQVTFSVEFDRDTMQIGDNNVYRLKVAHPANVTIRSIDLKPFQTEPLSTQAFYQDTSLTNDPAKMAQMEEYFRQQGLSNEVMEIKSYGNWSPPGETMMLSGSEANWTTQNTGQQVLKENEITFTYWEEGIHKVISPIIEYEQNGQLRTVTPPRDIEILVGSPLEKETQPIDSLTIAPLKDIIDEPFDWVQDFLIPAGMFLVGLIFLIGLIYLITKKRNQPKEVIEPPKEYIPASVIAMENLQKLKQEQVWQKGNIKEYQSRLTYIIREYLENRYEINALENTTFQIGQDLKSLNLKESLRNDLQNILQVADLVKFAKAEPDANVHDQFMTKSEEFVESTKKSTAQVEQEKAEQEKAYTQALEESQKEGYKLARLDYRLYATLIDIPFLLLHIFLFGMFVAIPSMTGLPKDNMMVNGIFQILGVLVFLFFFFGYAPVFGGSPGKLILGMRIFKEHTQQKISVWQAVKRFAAKSRDISFLFSIGSAIANKQRKLRYDERTGTEVVIKNQ